MNMITMFQNFFKVLLARGQKAERGNVLFLILIAVALFAALSYAVTSSSRSGGGDAGSETSLVNSASITQYPASVRTAIVRMLVSNGVSDSELNFDPPADFATTCTATPAPCVFHPSGGGATYVQANSDLMEDAAAGDWIVTSDYAITNVGTSANDIIAFLPGLKPAVCKKLNAELGLSGGTDTDADGVGVGASTIPVLADGMKSGNLGIGGAANAAHTIAGAFSGQAFGCYDATDATRTTSDLVYYHVVVER